MRSFAHGAIAQPDMRGGSQPLSASDVDLLTKSSDRIGESPRLLPTDDNRRDPPNRCRLLRAQHATQWSRIDGLEILAA